MKNVPTNLGNLKSKVDTLNVDKLVPAPVDLSKLSNIVKNDVVKIKNIENKIPDITKLATNSTLKAKVNVFENKILNITSLATTAALTAVENKIPNVSNLVKKSDYNTKISDIENKVSADNDHDKYVNTQEFNMLTTENFISRLAQAKLASKSDIANFVKKEDFDDKLKKLNKTVTSKKSELDKLSEKVKAI